MVVKKSIGCRIFDLCNILLLSILALSCIYPMIHILAASFSEPQQLIQHRGILLHPLGFTFKGYKLVLSNPNILNGYKNTIFYVVIGTMVNIIMTSIGAYVVSRRNFLYGKILMIIIVFTMFFSGGLIPFYILIQKIHLYNTRAALIIPTAISTWNLIIMRTAFMAVPKNLEESAKIDGANDIVILFRIILPLSKPVVAVMVLFYAVGHWNSWFNAMVFLKDRKMYPLQLILKEILIQNDMSSTIDRASTGAALVNDDLYKALVQYSTIIVATVPILLIYPFIQKYFVKGIMIGSIKG